MTPAATPDACIDRYALPYALGGWVAREGMAGTPTIRAALGGVEVGWAIASGTPDPEGRLRFQIDFPEPLPPGCIAGGTLVCRIAAASDPAFAIPYWETLVQVDAMAGALATLAQCRAHLGDGFAGVAANLLASFPDRIDQTTAALPRPLLAPPAPIPDDAPASDVASPLHLPLGLASKTGDAILGRDGFAFLLQGSNAILDQYRLPPDAPQVVDTAEAWMRLLAERRSGAAQRGIAFRQMIVPEKSTLLPGHMPPGFAVGGPTPLLARIERGIAARPDLRLLAPSALDLLRADRREADAVRRIDTHLTPLGAFRLARSVLDPADATRVPEPAFTHLRWRHADLADRFFDVALLDPVLEASAPRPADLAMVEQHVPHLDRHIGRRQVWRCPSAPVRRRIVVFGNSFCNFADYGEGYLSHWLAMWFAEFHFVWDPAVDWTYVDAVRPDLLLCQTIERFLGVVPAR